MELTRMRGRMETLNKIGQEMSMALKREQLIRRAVTGLRNDLGYKGALIVLKKEDAEELHRPRHSVPIRIGRRGIGTIVVPVAYWTPIDQELLEMFAAHVAVALQNIRFREKMQDIASPTGVLNGRQILKPAQNEVDNGSTSSSDRVSEKPN